MVVSGAGWKSVQLQKTAPDCNSDGGRKALDMQFVKRTAEIVVHGVLAQSHV